MASSVHLYNVPTQQPHHVYSNNTVIRELRPSCVNAAEGYVICTYDAIAQFQIRVDGRVDVDKLLMLVLHQRM